jgi:hypothetical protein
MVVHWGVEVEIRRHGVRRRDRVVVPMEMGRTCAVPVDMGVPLGDGLVAQGRVKRIPCPRPFIELSMGMVMMPGVVVMMVLMASIMIVVVVVVNCLAHFAPGSEGDPQAEADQGEAGERVFGHPAPI